MILMDMDRGGENMTVDEAKDLLRQQHEHSGEHPVVVKYPWWVTLRAPLLLMALAFLVNSIAIAGLSALQVRDTNANDETEEVRACRDLFTADITVAAANTRAVALTSQAAFNAGLADLAAGEEIDVSALVEANAQIPEAIEAEREAIAARDAWDQEGHPLPCPIGDS